MVNTKSTGFQWAFFYLCEKCNDQVIFCDFISEIDLLQYNYLTHSI